MKKLKKKIKENWLPILIGLAIGYFGQPHIGALIIQDSLKDSPAIEIIDETLTDSSPKAIIKEKGIEIKKEESSDEDNK